MRVGVVWGRAGLGLLFASVGWAQAIDTRESSFERMQPSTQALQRDDTQNPAMLWVQSGRLAWSMPPTASSTPSAKACAHCHGNIDQLKGVATGYPKFSQPMGRVVNLSQRINQCRVEHQQQAAWPPEHETLLGIEAAIAKVSRGQALAPMSANVSPPLQASQDRGQVLFGTRIGQINLSCRDCHSTLAGQRLGGSPIVQGHPTAYPIYRLAWDNMGSLQRRIRSCMTAVRAQPFEFGAQELIDIEAHLARRAQGMASESPGVRP